MTVFLAAFVAGGTAAVGVNRFVDVARTQAQPTIECEPIFVAIRPLAAGSPVTVWDVALHEWPKAMVPAAAIRPEEAGRWCDDESRSVARVAIREGQPILKHQLGDMPADATVSSDPPPVVSRFREQEEHREREEDPARADGPAESLVRIDEQAREIVAVTEPVATPPKETVVAVVEPTPATDPTTDPTADAEADAATGDGWPTAAEAFAGTEASMRFLVVPERIAILADALSAPPATRPVERPAPAVAAAASKPVAGSVAGSAPPRSTQLQPAPRGISPSPAVRQRTSSSTSANSSTKSPPASQASTSVPPVTRDRRTTNPEGQPRVQPKVQPQVRPQVSAPQAPPSRSAAVPPPRVRVEPEAEIELPEEEGPLLKSVFPNMAAGLEKFESEMSRIRRERFGAIFGGSTTESNRGPR